LISLNPDTIIVSEIKEKLKENDGYCPCSLVKTPDTKCMCKEFRLQESGMCHCGLYIKT
jgi:ferredoxin-thioredoxin reductase catalytic subunit